MSSTQVADLDKYFTPPSEENATEFVEKAMEIYDQLKDLSDPTALHILLESLWRSHDLFNLYIPKMCKILLERGYLDNTCTIIESLMKENYLKIDVIWLATRWALGVLYHFIGSEPELASSALETRIPSIVIDKIINNLYMDDQKNEKALDLLLLLLSIVQSLARQPGNLEPFKTEELKNVLVRLTGLNTADKIPMTALLTLSVIMDQSELKPLDEGQNVISRLVKHAYIAKSESSRQYNGFHFWELIDRLRSISSDDNMKKIIVRIGAIPLLIDVLKFPSTEEEIEKSLGTVLNLCFDPFIGQILSKIYDIKDIINTYESSQSPSIKTIYDGIIWLLGNKEEYIHRVRSRSESKSQPTKANKTWKYDIFFSYPWVSKPIILKIKEELQKLNITVWIDVDQMKGSIYETMADGIENSRIFVMMVSEAYRTSANCRIEAEYACTLKKPIIPLRMDPKYTPISWLGLITGGKTYYGFSERHDFQESLKNLSKNIEMLLSNNVFEGDQTDKTDSKACMEKVRCYKPSVGTIRDWTKTDVEKWLKDSALSDMTTKFAEIDGRMLNSMGYLSEKAPDYFFKSLKTEFGLNMLDILRLNDGLQHTLHQ